MAKPCPRAGVLTLTLTTALLLTPAAHADEEVFDPVSVLGPAPPVPAVGGAAGGGFCDQPDIAFHPRCRAWRQEYEAWQEKAQALIKEHAEQTGK